jgi:hypothetical protein
VAGLWQNPELVRHIRVELRPKRMIMAAAFSVFICSLIVLLFSYTSGQLDGGGDEYHSRLYVILVSLQAVVLCLWCLSSCSQGIASERMLKTYDFLRTTRLTSAELLFGMVFGLPLMAYFIVVCTLPFTLFMGLSGGFSILAIVATYAMLLLVSVVISLAGLVVSMLTESPRAGGLLLLFIAWSGIGFMIAVANESPFPSLIAIAVVPGLFPLYGYDEYHGNQMVLSTHASLFGFQVPLLVISIVLYVTFGAWLALVLVRNLKKDLEDVRLLSRWQGIGFAAYVNALVFALFDLRLVIAGNGGDVQSTVSGVTTGYLAMNFLILYAVGLAMLTPRESLKAWSRRSPQNPQRYWSEDSPPWPWMAASAGAAFLVFALAAVASGRIIPLAQWPIPAVRLFILLSYAARDVLFLQWCTLTRMKRPILGGILLLSLYYASVATILVILSKSEFILKYAMATLTPLVPLFGMDQGIGASLIGAAINIAISILLLRTIQRRLARPVSVPVPA